MNHTSEVERVERQLDDAMSARPRNKAACVAALEEAVALSRAGLDGQLMFSRAELLDELASAYGDVGRFDDAVRTMREAVDTGLGGVPDSRCRIAEILMRAGRAVEAEPIWAKVRADTPGDVWLFNDAGLEYAAIDDHATALAWLTEGLRLALDGGDPERLVPQLTDLRGESLTALGLEPDDLQARGVEFQAVHRRDAKYRIVRTVPRIEGVSFVEQVAGAPVWSWFPADEYERALAQWPELTGSGGLATGGRGHSDYCRALEVKLVEASRSGTPIIRIAPIRVDALLAWCAERGQDLSMAWPEYVTALAQDHPEQLILWPPRRNEPCWCGSAARYKTCCGSPGS